MSKLRGGACLILFVALATTSAIAGEEALLRVGDHSLRIVSPNILELIFVNTKDPDPARVQTWNLVNTNYQFQAPAPADFLVTINGASAGVQSILGFKRRPLYAPLVTRDLRIQNSLYLQLTRSILDNQIVEVKNPPATLWASNVQYMVTADPLRYSPAIHVNQEGYAPGLPKKAVVSYYLGNLGELNFSSSVGFKLVDAATGAQVYSGSLVWKPDTGYTYTPTPYQNVYVADFSSFNTPGVYKLMVPYLGASLPFRIDDGLGLDFARAYALGLYHQRCGMANAFPFTRFIHGPCHTNTVDVPSPQFSFTFTWNTISNYSSDSTNNPRHTAPQLKSEATQLYPFVNLGKFNVSGGHHDAGDYSKYTINSAGLIHYLMFAVDAFPGVGALDNLGTPESGDGVGDLMQEAKWEADFLAKMQDTDGGFYFFVYPKNREYEYNVLPDQGDPQVVWPKNTAVTAAAVAALAQTASSPRFKQAYPAARPAWISVKPEWSGKPWARTHLLVPPAPSPPPIKELTGWKPKPSCPMDAAFLPRPIFSPPIVRPLSLSAPVISFPAVSSRPRVSSPFPALGTPTLPCASISPLAAAPPKEWIIKHPRPPLLWVRARTPLTYPLCQSPALI